MTLREKIGQLMMVGFEGSESSDQIIEMIANNKVGSIILFARNIISAKQVSELNERLQTTAKKSGHKYPLIIATDQENGIVRRLKQPSTEFPGNMVLGAVNDNLVTYEVSKATARELKSLGINMNLAPVLDVNSNSENPVIGVRSFGENAKDVAKQGVEFIKGHQAVSVITSAKHFPGHGNTFSDSHHEIPIVNSSLEALKKVDLIPFVAAINSNIACIMISHVHYTDIDRNQKIPASISRNVINGLLRKELRYNGLVLTDCLEMNAISKTIGTPEGALRALKSGADMLVVSHTYSEQLKVIDHIEEAVLNDEIKIEVIEKSIERIHKIKSEFLSRDTKKTSGNFNLGKENLIMHKQLAKSAYECGITVVKSDGLFPLEKRDKLKIHVLWMLENNQSIAEDSEQTLFSIGKLVGNNPNIRALEETWDSNLYIDYIADDSDITILFTNYHRIDEKQASIIGHLVRTKRMIIVAIKSPYVLSQFMNAPNLIATYEPSTEALIACLKVIVGEVNAVGKLPITLK